MKEISDPIQQMNKQIPVHYSAGKIKNAIEKELHLWQTEAKVKRLWSLDKTLWSSTDEDKWMGWLDVASENKELSGIEELVKEIQTSGFVDIVLMGMGGSSLCPELMANTFGNITNFPRLHVIDSTDPLQIRHLEERINLKKTFFIVSSKSGSTLEPNSFKDYFYNQLQIALNKKEVGDHFIAITDPGSSLEKIAKHDHFKAIFYGKPSIGGRYSALSNFGIVPSALMGVNVKAFLRLTEPMQQACSSEVLVQNNPGIILGVILGICAKEGKDKVTLITSPGIFSLGAWLEQLLAESTGKNGKGLIPVDQEPLGKPDVYNHDRVFVYIRLDSAPDYEQDRAVQLLEQAGFVVVQLHVPDKMHLGAEFFRWEIATAVAGSVIGINPFNQPDVEDSKILTLQLTQQYEQSETLSEPTSFFSEDGISLFTDETNLTDLTKNLIGTPSLANYLHAHLNRVHPNDYVNFSAFIEKSDTNLDLLQESRLFIRNHKKAATCLGFGPQFLHSTGQAYKGGPNTGVFFQITADSSEDLAIPGHKYTFGVIIAAQAQADFTVLTKRARRVLRIHLGKDVHKGLRRLSEIFATK